jgi:polyisoprenyl-phosphate glycosyltransferase
VRSFSDPNPYFRGMLAESGLPYKKIYYDPTRRKLGSTKCNWYTLYDIGMLCIINRSNVPLGLAGFHGAGLPFLVAVVYLILKLIFWTTFSFGLGPC